MSDQRKNLSGAEYRKRKLEKERDIQKHSGSFLKCLKTESADVEQEVIVNVPKPKILSLWQVALLLTLIPVTGPTRRGISKMRLI